MVYKKQKRMHIVFFAVIFLSCFLFGENVPEQNLLDSYKVSPEFATDYNTIYSLQTNVDSLNNALFSCLSTLLYSKENFSSETNMEFLLKRIYSKIDLTNQYSSEDLIFNAIISENSSNLLSALSALDEATSTYERTYGIMEFLSVDFIESLEYFRFDEFKNYLEINKLLGFNLVERLSGDQLKALTNHLINAIKSNQYYFGNDLYIQLVQFGGEKFINYLSIQIMPYININDEETYKEQLSLLNTYVNIYRIYYKSDFEDKIPKENYNYYHYLSTYFDYLENVEILSKRFITTEATTLSSLSTIFLNYLKQYNSIQIKTEILDEKVQELIKNASTRLVYADSSIKSSYTESVQISINNQEIRETLSNFNLIIKTDISDETEAEKKGFFKNIIDYLSTLKINLLYFIFLPVLSMLVIYLALPLKTKGVLLKQIGFTGKALQILQKASIQKPMDADIHIKTAQIYEKMGRDEDAINEYKIASKVIDMKGE